MWPAYLVKTQMCLSYYCIGWIGQTCSARCRWNAGMVQYFTPMPLVLTLVRNTCSYQVCLYSVIVIQLPTLDIRKQLRRNYFRWQWYHLHRLDECNNTFLCCLIWSATRKIHGISSLKYFHKEEEKSLSGGLTALLSHYLAICQQSIWTYCIMKNI